jgi:hypothetical protein
MKRRPPHQPARFSAQRQRLLAALLFGAAAVALAVYYRLQFHWVMGDENEHLYVARQVASGVSLYGGIHSARPPLILLPLVVLIRCGVEPLFVARLCVFLTVVATAVVLFRFGTRWWGLWSGLAAAVLFMLSPDVARMFPFVGIQQTAFLGLLCLLLRLEGLTVWSGLVGGLAIASGQHSAVIVAAAALFQVRSAGKSTVTFILAALGVLTLIVAACVAAGGTGIWMDLIGNHLYHLNGARNQAQAQSFTWRLVNWACANAGILFLAATGALVGFNDRRVRCLSLVTALHLITVVAMNSGFAMYLIPASPLLAALAGYGMTQMLGRLKLWRQSQGWRWPSVRRVFACCLYLLVAAGGLWSSQQICNDHYSGSYSFWPHRRELELSRVASMEPADRVAGVVSGWVTPGSSLFGGPPELVSYLALRTGIRMAGQLADLSSEWMVNGTVRRSSVISQLENDRIEVFVASAGDFYLIDHTFQDYLLKCYSNPIAIPPVAGNLMGGLYLFKHKPEQHCE